MTINTAFFDTLEIFSVNFDFCVYQSEQQLVDCAQDFSNHGCEGWAKHLHRALTLMLSVAMCWQWWLWFWSRGLPSQAFEYIKYNKGLMTESGYPYTARVGPKGRRTFWRILDNEQQWILLIRLFLFIKEGKCKYKPELAAAFVKNVVNITAVSELFLLFKKIAKW